MERCNPSRRDCPLFNDAPIDGKAAGWLSSQVERNGRYLVDQRGTPFLVVGDTPWSLIVQLDEPEMERYLKDRRDKGFNSIIVNLIEHKFSTSPPRMRSGLAPFNKPGDFSTPNIDYFDFAHKAVKKAGEYGIVVWLAPAYLGYGGGDEGFFQEIKAGGKDKLRAYGRFVGRRFRDLSNIVWMLGGDYTPDRSDQWTLNELARAIREEDQTHLMTAHHSPGSSALAALGEQEWLAVNTVYSYDANRFRPLLAEYERRPVHPFVLIEATYEGEHNSTPIRSAARPTGRCSAGLRPVLRQQPDLALRRPGPLPAKTTWQMALDAPGSRDMALLRKLMVDLPWYQWIPEEDHPLVTEGYGSNASTALTAGTPDKTLSVAYIPSTGRNDGN